MFPSAAPAFMSRKALKYALKHGILSPVTAPVAVFPTVAWAGGVQHLSQYAHTVVSRSPLAQYHPPVPPPPQRIQVAPRTRD